MLQVGLTGGIGAGKSTVARRLAELGATVVDADVVAREVVRPGSPGLARVVAEFGSEILDSDGALDRPALAGVVFSNPAARGRLNGIVHPLVRQRTAELVAAAPPDAVVVQDIPLLVEGGMAAAFALVVVVDAAEDERVRRLVADRGMTEEQARARIAAQADRSARRAAADVWLDNAGSPEQVRVVVDRLWRDRMLPFERHLRMNRPLAAPPARLVEADPTWSEQFARLAARITRAAGEATIRVDHVGPTSVPGLAARDVLDIQLVLPGLDSMDGLTPALRAAGFIHYTDLPADETDRGPRRDHPDGHVFTSADPGRRAELRVRALESPGWRHALLLRDWLRADVEARADYVQFARRVMGRPDSGPDGAGYGALEQRWFESVSARAERWAQAAGWSTPEHTRKVEPKPQRGQKV
jgi:dephospho-CoA kinase